MQNIIRIGLLSGFFLLAGWSIAAPEHALAAPAIIVVGGVTYSVDAPGWETLDRNQVIATLAAEALANQHRAVNGTFTVRPPCGNIHVFTILKPKPPVIPKPTLKLTATPTRVNYNNASTLKWSTTNATSCRATGSWSGNKAVSGSQSTGKLTTTPGPYTMTCTGPGGSVKANARVTVAAAPAPAPTQTPAPAATPTPTATMRVSVNDDAPTTANRTVEAGDKIELFWGSTNAQQCLSNGFPTVSGNPVSMNDYLVATPSAGSPRTYSVRCDGAGGYIDSNAVTVTTTVRKPSLTPSSIIVERGSSITLSYDLNGNSSCTFSSTGGASPNSGTPAVTTNGALTTSAITQQTVFTLNCPGGSDTVIIRIEGDIQEQ